MIKTVARPDRISINVILKNGAKFINKDITDKPAGEQEQVISFWLDDHTIRAYPLTEVHYFEYVVK